MSVVILLLWGQFDTVAQNTYHFKQFPEEHILAQLAPKDILQDRQGFLWIGTRQGLIRYDGVRTLTYQHHPFEANTICSSDVWAICEDSDEAMLWIATMGGLARYDQRSRQFRNYSHDPDAIGSRRCPSEENITFVTQATDGTLWLGTGGGGLNAFDPHSEQFTYYYPDSTTDYSSDFNHLGYVAEDANGHIWFGTQADLIRLDPANGQMTRYADQIGKIRTNFALTESSEGGIWAITELGIFLYDPAAQAFSQLPVDISRWKADFGLDWRGLYAETVLEDRRQRLWFGGWDNGLFVCDLSTYQVSHFKKAAGEPGTMRHNSVNTLYQDRDQRIWIGTHGLECIDPFYQKLTFVPLDLHPDNQGVHPVAGVREDPNGDLWLCSIGNGLIRYQPQTQRQQAFFWQPLGTANNYFRNVIPMGDDLIWVESWMSGVGTFDAKTEKFGSFPQIEGLPAVPDRFWQLDTNLIALLSDRQLFFYHLPDHTLSVFPDSFASIYSYRPYRPILLRDSRGFIWLGMDGEGLLRYNPNDRSYRQFRHRPDDRNSLSSDKIRALLEDRHGNIWIGTDEHGVNLLSSSEQDRVQPRFRHWLQAPAALISNHILSLQEDKNGRIWINTPMGLSCLDPEQESFRNFDVAQCRQSFYWPEASCKGRDGTLYFGGMAGLTVVQPDLIPLNSRAPAIVLTQLSIDNEAVDTLTPFLPQSIEFAEKLVLAYDQNDLTFAFAALDYTQPSLNRYQYRMAGYQDEWIAVDGLRPEANFTNLQPGDYQLEIKAANPDGIWNESGYLLPITILPPWWRTPWAMALWAVLITGILYTIYWLQFRRQLAQAENRSLRALDEMKTSLYTNITHEFRTPLTIIIGMSEQFSHQLSEHVKEGVQLIRKNAHQLLHLVNQMLDLAKLESGNLPLQQQQGDIVNYLRYLTESFHSLAAEKQIELQFECAYDEIMMDYDPVRLMHVMSNLISNAIKFSPTGKDIRISVEVVAGPAQEERLSISVADQGIGIAQSKLPLIFDRFYQIDDSPTRSGEGTGIGLTLTRELVHLMGGTVEVSSELGKGSLFCVLLPLTRQAPLMEKTGEQVFVRNIMTSKKRATAPAAPQAAADKPLLLIVEDNRDMVYYMKRILSPLYRLQVAYDGQAGIELAKRALPDLIITDVMMPEKDGYELCTAVKGFQMTSHIPIIMLTAKVDTASRLSGLRRGADAYLEKPFLQEELQVRIQALLEQRQKLQSYYRSSIGLSEGQAAPEIITEGSATEINFLLQINRMLEDKLNDTSFTVEQLAQALFVSPSNLYRKLKALTGKNTTQYIRSFRLNKAKELLRSTDQSIIAIAFAVGFNDADYFSRVFKKETGSTPTAFRQSHSSA